MIEVGTGEKKVKYYTPNAQMVSHMRRRLQIVEVLGQVSADGHDVPDELEYEKRALATDKTRILEILFQGMADITFFFGIMDTYPRIRQIFEDDIKEILGVKRDNPKTIPYGFAFNILVSGMLLSNYPTGKDFRLRLNQQLQRLIWNKMSLYLKDIFESYAIQQTVVQDFNRVFGWAEMLMFAMKEKDEYRIPDVITVSGPKTESGVQPTEEEKRLIDEEEAKYSEDVRRNSPRRTFNFKDVSDILPIE